MKPLRWVWILPFAVAACRDDGPILESVRTCAAEEAYRERLVSVSGSDVGTAAKYESAARRLDEAVRAAHAAGIEETDISQAKTEGWLSGSGRGDARAAELHEEEMARMQREHERRIWDMQR